jgi:hypothetical protein
VGGQDAKAPTKPEQPIDKPAITIDMRWDIACVMVRNPDNRLGVVGVRGEVQNGYQNHTTKTGGFIRMWTRLNRWRRPIRRVTRLRFPSLVMNTPQSLRFLPIPLSEAFWHQQDHPPADGLV